MLRFSKKILSARKSSTLNLVFQTASFSSITTKETTTSQKLVPSSPIVHEVPNITKNLELMKGKGQSAYFDFIEHWSRGAFYNTGYGLSAIAVTLSGIYGICQETLIVDFLVFGYWVIGYNDIHQKHHTVLRNFPVLGNIRYFLEMLRPELRQYLLETDDDGKPYDRMSRSMTYQRAKGVRDTLPFGTRLDVYSPGYEWANHSMFPVYFDHALAGRIEIGGSDCTQKYSASILNVSGMSYGALSDAAVTALSKAAAMGGFYHNTGEGGISRFHIEGGGDLVWNIGTGYFGCRNPNGTFNADMFRVTANNPQVKMIEIKLSQGAKPGHGGLLPGPKVTPFIAEARGVAPGVDCHSPPRHSAFDDAKGLVHFIRTLRNLSNGKPVGFKLCVGRPEEFTAVVAAMVSENIYPDFITVDGSEGGTGAAPPEFSNTVGMPLVEGLSLVNSVLIGAGIRDKIKIICSGKVVSGFSVVRNMALGADVCNAARAMLFALGCIQALKCDTNKCPTGITTQDKELMKGLDIESKSVRVASYHSKTVENALDIIGAMGVDGPSHVRPEHIMKRVTVDKAVSFAELYPQVASGDLIRGKGTPTLQRAWEAGLALNKKQASDKKNIVSKSATQSLQSASA